MFVNPQDVSICMSMCLNTTTFWPIFCSCLQSGTQVVLSATPPSLCSLRRNNQASLRVPEHCGHAPSSLAVRGELLPQQLARSQPGGCLQSTWMHMQLFPARQSCSSPSLEIKVLRRCQLVSPLGVCPFCLQENSYVLESFTAIIPNFRQQWTHVHRAAVKAVLSASCTHRADVSHAQQPDQNPACCFMISDHCGNHSVACFAAVTSPLCSPPAFAGFPHYTTHLAIFPELKLLPFLACFRDYSMIIYDVIKSSAIWHSVCFLE